MRSKVFNDTVSVIRCVQTLQCAQPRKGGAPTVTFTFIAERSDIQRDCMNFGHDRRTNHHQFQRCLLQKRRTSENDGLAKDNTNHVAPNTADFCQFDRH